LRTRNGVLNIWSWNFWVLCFLLFVTRSNQRD
jgi:hypothetical protein